MRLLADLGPHHGDLSIGLLMAACFPESKLTQVRENKEESPGWKPLSFYNLVSEVMSHYFCHILLIRYESVNPVHTQAEGLRKGIEYQEVGSLRPILEATYHIHPNIMDLDLVNVRKHWTTDEKGNCKDICLVSLSLLLSQAPPKLCSKYCGWSKPVLINFIVSSWISARKLYIIKGVKSQ